MEPTDFSAALDQLVWHRSMLAERLVALDAERERLVARAERLDSAIAGVKVATELFADGVALKSTSHPIGPRPRRGKGGLRLAALESVEIELPKPPQQRRRSKIERAVAEALRHTLTGMTFRELQGVIKCAPPSLSRFLKRAVGRNQIIKMTGNKYALAPEGQP